MLAIWTRKWFLTYGNYQVYFVVVIACRATLFQMTYLAYVALRCTLNWNGISSVGFQKFLLRYSSMLGCLVENETNERLFSSMDFQFFFEEGYI